MILVDIAIVAALVYAAFAGSKRGLVLIGLELISFVLATAVALVTYHPVGAWTKDVANAPAALGNLAAFAIIWIVIEILVAVLIRVLVLPRLQQHPVVHASWLNHSGGAALNALKSLVIITLGLIVFAGLPVSSASKRAVTDSYLGGLLLTSSGQLQSWLAGGLGHDLGESLTFFTVPAAPEDDHRIDLGYTATGPADPASEEAMLRLINEERATHGLNALTMNETARTVARAYSTDMFARGYFSHINLEGKSPFDRMRAGGVEFNAAGENLALAPTLALAHQGLMNSPGHRANILSDRYHTVGIGIIDGGPYGLMVTQNFTD